MNPDHTDIRRRPTTAVDDWAMRVEEDGRTALVCYMTPEAARGFAPALGTSLVVTSAALEERLEYVVAAAFDWQNDTGECHFCGFIAGHRPHSEDCPLVEKGFITRAGELVPEEETAR